MADKARQIVLEGLSRAVAEPGGQPLFGSKRAAGLFASTAAAKQAAQHCKELGYLQVLSTQTKGKALQEVCAITEKGIAYLLSELSPKQVLQEFVRAVEARGRQVTDLVEAARLCQTTLDSLKTQVEKVLPQLQAPPPTDRTPFGNNGARTPANAWIAEILTYLTDWQATRPNEDCPLPELYQRAKQLSPGLTVGQFHDGLRLMHDRDQVYLHPWTGPLYEIPDPAYALLVGHAVVYYVSRKA